VKKRVDKLKGIKQKYFFSLKFLAGKQNKVNA